MVMSAAMMDSFASRGAARFVGVDVAADAGEGAMSTACSGSRCTVDSGAVVGLINVASFLAVVGSFQIAMTTSCRGARYLSAVANVRCYARHESRQRLRGPVRCRIRDSS